MQRDVVVEHADGATATLSVVVFSVIAGILHLMEDTDELGMKLPLTACCITVNSHVFTLCCLLNSLQIFRL